MLAAASEGPGEKVDAGRGFRDPWEKGFVLSMGSWGLRDTASGTGTTIIIPIYRHGNGGTDGVGTGEPRHPVQHTLNFSPDASVSQERPWEVQAGGFLCSRHDHCRGAVSTPLPQPCLQAPEVSSPHPHFASSVFTNTAPGFYLGKVPRLSTSSQ